MKVNCLMVCVRCLEITLVRSFFFKCLLAGKTLSAATYKFYMRPRRFHLHSPSFCHTQHPEADKPHHRSATHSPHNLDATKQNRTLVDQPQWTSVSILLACITHDYWENGAMLWTNSITNEIMSAQSPGPSDQSIGSDEPLVLSQLAQH